MKPRWPTCMVIGWLIGAVAACGRIGFDPTELGVHDAVPGDGSAVPVDTTSDAGLCDYLPTCAMGEITCCAATGSSCMVESPGTCSGTIARCSIYTQQGCPPRWACCSTPQRPEPSCYDPIMPQPC